MTNPIVWVLMAAVGYLLAGVIGYQTNSAAALIATPVTFLILAGAILFLRRRSRAAA
ncbi:MAG: hypothetical protein IJ705_01030 [Oscillospiraceae bacterium]|nr:hypothetical protein [Oscillospiraceae bacterium]